MPSYLPSTKDGEMTPLTGYFRDGKRRIDMVLVARNKCVLRRFMTELLKLGFDIEIEAGRMSIHRHLLFIKLHASDDLIERHAEIFFYTRYFNEMHRELIPADSFCPMIPFITYFFPCSVMCHEKTYLGMMHYNYPTPCHFSTLDRSRIVYDLLTNATFRVGRCRVCLKQLMVCNVIVDMYALHDGPYFLLRNQIFIESNGRQILYEFWTGLNNMCRVQPLYIIYEYFGERIGFFFAFYGLYNMFLIPLAIVGVLAFLADWFGVKESDVSSLFCSEEARTRYTIGSMDVWQTTAASPYLINMESSTNIPHWINYRSYPLLLTLSDWYKNFWFCPNCRHYNICPFRREFELCEESRMNDSLETPVKLFFWPLFAFIWAALFLKIWKRTELFYLFMWQIDTEYAKYSLRTHCLGINVLLDGTCGNKIWKCLWNIILLAICFLTALLLLYHLLHYRYYLMYIFMYTIDNNTNRKYYIIAFIGIINMAIVYTLERMSRFVVYKMICFEHLETHIEREETIARRLFAVSFIFTFMFIAYIAFVKGKFNTTPVDRRNLKILGGILMENCDPLTCMDEVLILIVVILVMRELVFRFIPYIRLFGATSDYSIKCWYNRWPYWERERFMYKDFQTEDFLMMKYREITMQFAAMILFVGICPLAPALALLVNAIDIRYCARRFLLYTRRPLIRRAYGIGPWREILVFLVFLMAFFGTMLVTVTSDYILRANADLKLETDVYDNLNYQREHITYALFTQVNGVQGDANRVTKIGHIPLALFPEYDYLMINPDWITTSHTRGNDKVLYQDFEKYMLYTPRYWRSPCYGWYEGCHFKNKIRVGCLWRTVWGETFPTDSPFTAANCTLVYDTTVRRHCYMKGFITRFASVTRSAKKIFSEEITMAATTSFRYFSDLHHAHSYVTTWSTTSDYDVFPTYKWTLYYWNYTTSWFDTSLFRSWYFSWFEDMDGYPSRAQNNISTMNDFLGRNMSIFYCTTWIFVPFWDTTWFTTTSWYTGYYWSWYKNTSGGSWIHDFSTLFTTETWKFTLQYYADMYHSYGYVTNWQQLYITHQKWWFTVVPVTLLIMLFIMIYHCWPDVPYHISEIYATETNMAVSMFPKMKCE